PGLKSADFNKLFPEFISKRLRKGFEDFGRKSPGFLTNDAVMIGLESRTSSPVRFNRDSTTLQSTSVAGLYPAGEGAGYAGGIVSAAIDGIRCLRAAAEYIKNRKD
ncbi:MAG: FAD-binding protein, partial [Muribaculaceae bacterium]|nr:FAD-binding protein [Muribaculaceae bacterium]